MGLPFTPPRRDRAWARFAALARGWRPDRELPDTIILPPFPPPRKPFSRCSHPRVPSSASTPDSVSHAGLLRGRYGTG